MSDTDHLSTVQTAATRMEQAHQDRDTAIRTAHSDGASIVSIARAAGLSRQGIYKILAATD